MTEHTAVADDIVTEGSFLTLRYRVGTSDNITLMSTFEGNPSTFQMGSGELAPPLEQCLLGLKAGDKCSFILEPDAAYGQHNPQLVQRIARKGLPIGSMPELHGVLELSAPHGGKIAGRVRELDNETVLLDFNHPFAGRTIHFDVEIIGII